MKNEAILCKVRWLLVFFSVALIASGLTAIPLAWELQLLSQLAASLSLAEWWPSLIGWIEQVNHGIQVTFHDYPFIAYGTDWLAFGHVVIGIAFAGAIRDPVQNEWIIKLGMIACVLVVPWAMIFGELRGIPFYWRIIDSSFGLFGIIPLWLCQGWILKLKANA